jgi:hypothetical protein
MKRQSLLLLGWLLLATPTAVRAQFAYTVTNDMVTITGYTGTTGVVVIPDTITGLPVTAIGDWAFSGDSITVVTIPNSVTNIGGGAFAYCSSLTAINMETNNPAYSSVSGVLFDKSQTTLIEYPSGKVGSYSIPNSVTSIGDDAFAYCYGLNSVTIPNSVTSIGDGAFADCYGLTSVAIPNSVTSIGAAAFAGCNSLSSVIIPDSVTNIKDGYLSGKIHPRSAQYMRARKSNFLAAQLSAIVSNSFGVIQSSNVLLTDSPSDKALPTSQITYVSSTASLGTPVLGPLPLTDDHIHCGARSGVVPSVAR